MMLNLNQTTMLAAAAAAVVVLLITFVTITESLDPIQEARCLNCIRNVSTSLGTDVSKRCEGYYCGQYQLSYTYWAEAGKPGNNQGSRDYEKCARDKTCAEQAVRAYFRKFKRDCNNDGRIDCLDMAALHKAGPTSCTSDWFYKSRFWLAFNKTSCMTNREEMSDSSRTDYEEHSVPRPPIRVMKNQTLTPECLDCICDAVSGCNTSVNNCGSGTVCGPFAISQAYWKDGKRPGSSWTTCARTKECSSVAMKNYMEKYKRDCNDDGYITCEDYAAIHRRGPRACSNKDLLKDHYWNKFLACRANQKPLKDVNMVKVNESGDETNTSPNNLLASRGEQTTQINTITTILPPFADLTPPQVANNAPDNIAPSGSNGGGSSNNNLFTIMSSHAPLPSTIPTHPTMASTTSNHFDYSQTPNPIVAEINSRDENNPKSSTQRVGYQGPDHHHYHHHHHHHHHTPSSSSTAQQDEMSTDSSKQKFELNSEVKFETSHEYRPYAPTSPAHEQTISAGGTSSSSRPIEYDPLSPIIIVPHRVPQNNVNSWSQVATPPTTSTTTTTTTTPVPVSLKSEPATTIYDTTYTRMETTPVQQPKPTSIDNFHNSNSNEEMNSASIAHEASHLAHPGDHLAGLVPQSSQNLQSNSEQPILGTSGDEIDYSDVFPSQGAGIAINSPDRTSSFDKTVIDIVSNKDFSKSYPPVPDLNVLDKQTEASPVDEINQGLPGKFQSKILGSGSKSPAKPGPQLVNESQPSRTTIKNGSSITSVSSAPVSTATTNVATSPIYTRSTIGQQVQYQQPAQTSQQPPPQPQTTKSLQEAILNDNRPDLIGSDSLNFTSLFDKALNESSRIASECLECICDASSNCDTSVQCISKQREKNRCGLYMISWNQFQESDISLTGIVLGLNGAGGSEEPADEKMYYDCTTDRVCAEKLIHLYIEKHQRDCNNDGKIDCYDIAAIHRVGPENCNSGKFLSSQYWKDFNICYTTDRLTTTSQPQMLSQLFS